MPLARFVRRALAASLIGLAGLVAGASTARAQTPPLTLPDLLTLVASTDPEVVAAGANRDGATAAVDLARSADLPRAQALAQVNRATTNNVFGMLLPPGALPPISGPPAAEARATSVWGSAVGAVLTWDAVDFGRRASRTRASAEGLAQAEARLELARLGREVAAAEAFLTLLAADARVQACEVGLTRAQTLQQAVDAQVSAELRPGADASRAAAETARAEVRLEDARLDARRARVAVAALAARASEALEVDASLAARVAPAEAFAVATRPHPEVAAWDAAAREAEARRDAEARGNRPVISLSGTVYGRGSGALADGTLRSGAEGLWPDFYNWGVGVTVAVPLLDFKAVRARTAMAAAEASRADATRAAVVRDLRARAEQAAAEVTRASRVAALLGPQLDAARATEQQVRARYEVGLATLAEVADAQRLLADTDADAAVARLAGWLALLHAADAAGDLTPFLAAVGR